MKRGLVAFTAGEVAGLRITFASVFLLPFALRKIKHASAHHYPKLFFSGMIGVFIPAFLFTNAQLHLNSSIVGILNSLTPLWTLLIGAIFYKMIIKRSTFLGLLFGFVGAVILIFSKSGNQNLNFNGYGLLVVLACAFYGYNLFFVKYHIHDLRAMTITSFSVVTVAPLAIVYLFGFTDCVERLQTHADAWKSLGYIAILALFSTATAVWLFNKLVKIASPLFVSTVTYLIPLVSVLWGLYDGEVLNFSHVFGMAIIFVGVFLANMQGRNQVSKV